MAFQLVYTSVPAGLVAGRSGFSTVARHREIREALVSRIEAFSNVFDRGAQAAEDTLGLPVIHAFHHIRLGKSDYHVLSRIRDSGSDYSGRVNHIAHSLVLEPGELESLKITPAEALLSLEKKGFWLDKWDGGDPRYFDEGEKEPLDVLERSVKLPADHWEQATGSAAAAALPWEAASGERCHLVFEPDADAASILQLIAESQLVKDPERRSAATLWSTSFTTHLQSSDDRASFQWSAVKKGSPAHGRLGRAKGAVIEIAPGLEAPSGDLAAIAETGKARQEPAQAETGPAAGGAAVPPGMPLPTTRGVGIGGIGEAIPLGGSRESDAEDYQKEIDALIGADSGGGAGFSFRKVWPWVLVLAILVLGAVLLVPRYLQKKEVGLLVDQLNQKLVAAQWQDANSFYDGQIVRSPHAGAEPLKEPVAALRTAQELLLFHGDLSSLSKSAQEFTQIGKNVDWGSASRARLSQLRDTAKAQHQAWLEFQEQLKQGWTSLRTAMQPFESSPKTAVIAANAEALAMPSKNELSAVLGHFENDKASTSPYGAASEAIARISEARATVKRFAEVVGEVRDSKEPVPEEGDLKSEVEKLYGDISRLIGGVGGLEGIDNETLKPIEASFLKLAARSGDFIADAPPPVVVANEPPPKTKDASDGSQPQAAVKAPALDWLSPTHLVAWREDHQYQIELSQDFGACSMWSVVLPLVDINPESLDQFAWVTASGTDLRADLSKRPIFKRKLASRALSLSGQSGGLVDQPIHGEFALRFAKAQSKDAPADYQVVFLRYDAVPTGAPSRSKALIDIPVAGSLKRSEDNGAVLVRLQPEILAALAKIVPGDAAMKAGTPVLRVDMGEKGKKQSRPVSSGGGFSFSEVEMELLAGAASQRTKQEIEGELQKWTELDKQRVKFHETLATSGVALYQGVFYIDVKYLKNPNPNGPKIPKPDPKPETSSLAIGPPAQAGGRPPFVDYIVEIIEDVLGSKNVFDLSEKKGDDASGEGGLGGGGAATARGVLEEFVKSNAGWAIPGGDKFQEVRKALVAVREYAAKRTPRVSGGRGIVPPRKNDQGKVVEQWPDYLGRLRDRQRLINADVFFENWVKLFTDENLNKVWPYFEKSNLPEWDDRITGTVKQLGEEKADKERADRFAGQLKNDPLEALGSWRLDLELPGRRNPNSPDNPTPGVIPLIRFTASGGGAAPAAVVPGGGAPAAEDAVPSPAQPPAGGAKGKGKGKGKAKGTSDKGGADPAAER